MNWSDSELDAQLRSAAHAEPIETAALEKAIRARLGRAHGGWYAAAAAALILALRLSYSPAPDVFAQAVGDHRAEVVEHRPRHWRSDPNEIQTLAARYGLSASTVGRMAPGGYRLEHAKTCGLDGKPVLHLVYTDGRHEFSVYVTDGRAHGERTVGRARVAAFHSPLVSGIAVGSRAECDGLAMAVKVL
ncbi:MAG TPA: hypothetical protein VFC21_06825 [Bryobacteraceae bacterium]|nr:hypothetical protein [Bryobacteraceae bacterium]